MFLKIFYIRTNHIYTKFYTNDLVTEKTLKDPLQNN